MEARDYFSGAYSNFPGGDAERRAPSLRSMTALLSLVLNEISVDFTVREVLSPIVRNGMIL